MCTKTPTQKIEKTPNLFKGLYSFMDVFNNDDACLAYFETIRWKDGVFCAHCGFFEVTKLKTDKHTYLCKGCRKRFNVKTGTMFEDTRIPLRKWFVAIYLENASIGGVTSDELERHLEVSRPTAALVLRKIRQTGYNQDIFKETEEDLKDKPLVFEMDTMVRDGEDRSRHKWLKKKYKGGEDRKFILLILRRNGPARGYVIPNVQRDTMMPFIQQQIPTGATIYTDEANTFFTLKDKGYRHDTVIHSDGEYVHADVYTNTVEGWNSFFQTGLMKFRNHISAEYTQDYVNAAIFRYNTRDKSENKKLILVLENIVRWSVINEQLLTLAA